MDTNKKPIYYCNLATVYGSVNDFKIGFGIKKDTNTPVTEEEDIDLYIMTSPQHLKSLVLLLSRHLRIYEKMFGEINLEANEEAKKELANQIEFVKEKNDSQ